jgi:cAMP-dependent protein kinase regulator
MDWLVAHGVDSLFVGLVEQLLAEKPDDVVGALVRGLARQFPVQAMAEAQRLVGAQASEQARADGDDGYESDSSSEEEEDGEDDVIAVEAAAADAAFAPARARANQRRTNVCAEPPALADLAAGHGDGGVGVGGGGGGVAEDGAGGAASAPDAYPKSEAQAARITGLLRQGLLFAHLDASQMATVVGAVEPRAYEDGEVIIRQGETGGEHFFLLESGRVDASVVTAAAAGGEEKEEEEAVTAAATVVKTYCEDGSSFGELALLYNAPRAATCRAVGPVALWALDRATFKHITVGSEQRKRARYKHVVDQVPILSSLAEHEKLAVVDALREARYSRGDVLFAEGSPGDEFFIVKAGAASCTKREPGGGDVEVARLEEGCYFGEIALMASKPRQATVTACSDAAFEVFVLDRATFRRLLGPLDEIMNRNIGGYFRQDLKALTQTYFQQLAREDPSLRADQILPRAVAMAQQSAAQTSVALAEHVTPPH